MASIDRTAYPRFKRSISDRELRLAYSPSLDEMEWARGLTDTDDHLLSLTVRLKCCQRLGCFPRLVEIPGPVIGHLRDELGLHEGMFHTAIDMSTVIRQLRAEGHPVHRADLATIAPYQQDNVRRFGDYIYDLHAPLETMDTHLDLDDDPAA